MFIVEMNYKVTAAVHHRHKSHQLLEIEVHIGVLGHRAEVSSISNYLFNLVRQFFGFSCFARPIQLHYFYVARNFCK